jgi:hypothetical protein
LSHLAFKKKKTEQEKKTKKTIDLSLSDIKSLLFSTIKLRKFIKSTHCQFVSGGGKSPIVVSVKVDQ